MLGLVFVGRLEGQKFCGMKNTSCTCFALTTAVCIAGHADSMTVASMGATETGDDTQMSISIQLPACTSGRVTKNPRNLATKPMSIHPAEHPFLRRAGMNLF